MMADDPYFMCAVALAGARDDIDKALRGLNEKLPGTSVTMIRCAITSLTNAMEKMYNLKVCPVRLCECGCGRDATNAGYEGCV